MPASRTPPPAKQPVSMDDLLDEAKDITDDDAPVTPPKPVTKPKKEEPLPDHMIPGKVTHKCTFVSGESW